MRIDLQPSLQEPFYLAELLGAKLAPCGAPPVRVRGIATDTAEVQEGDLFLAIRGERTDGNNYVLAALEAGAVGVVTENASLPYQGNLWHFHCDDVQESILLAAGKWRQTCGACVVAVTGSAGKTTAKDAISHVLGNVPHNEGNYNSMIGMPLSVLSFPASKFWVCEIGINHVGEMEKMSAALRPDIGVITNVGSAHIGNFGNLQLLRQEKLKVCTGMGENGRLVLPISLKNIGFSVPLCHIFYVGEEKTADFAVENIAMSADGVRCDIRYGDGEITNLEWPMPGVIGSSVLGLAACVGVLCKRSPQEIREGLRRAALAPAHLSVYGVGEMLFVQDCYNASPEACLASLEGLHYLSGKRARVAVLGDMLELGEYSEVLHRALGEAVPRFGVFYLFTYGAQAEQIAMGARAGGMSGEHIFSFRVGEEKLLGESLLKYVPRDAAALIKGSRAMKMENVIAQIRRLL